MYAYVNSRSTDSIPQAALYLGLAGVLPFWAAAVLMWSFADPGHPPTASAISIAYGAIVLSFLGGVRWGIAIVPPARSCLATTLSLAVLPSLAGFAAMFMPSILGLAVVVSGFMLHALWDVVAADNGRIPQWFATLRLILTALVVPALLMVIARMVLAAVT